MLFIYRILPIGGIETFFVRMAKERFKLDLVTKVILLSDPSESNQDLLDELKKYAHVYFYSDLFYPLPIVSKYFPLIAPMRVENVKNIIKDVSQVHAFKGVCLLLGYRITRTAKSILPITVGFYHSQVYAWGDGKAYHEKKSREFIFRYIPKEALLMFCKENRDNYSLITGEDLKKANIFRIGVVDGVNNFEKMSDTISSNSLRIVSVGRLVDYKTYNFFMLHVVKSLLSKGFDVSYDIYGDGPLEGELLNKIKYLDLEGAVNLKGTLPYASFNKMVSEYDIFVGSGTAIIQAAALGVPSIVGIENMIESVSYGYFCDVHDYEFNIKGLDIPLKNIEQMIIEFFQMSSKDRISLKKKHAISIKNFTNYSCQQSMDSLNGLKMPEIPFKYNAFLYETSRALDQLGRVFNKNHPYNMMYKKQQ